MKINYKVFYKVFFGLLGFSAVITELAVLATNGKLVPVNFLSYFTIESNIVAFTLFLVSAFYVFAGRKSSRLDFFRGAATLYMIVTGIVFAVLLAGIEGSTLTAVPWDNAVLHYIIPVAAAVDWLIDPPHRRISFRSALVWLSFPVVYVVYSLVRGSIVGWYPYPFLNPVFGGYGKVAITSVMIFVFGIGLVWIVTRIGAKAK